MFTDDEMALATFQRLVREGNLKRMDLWSVLQVSLNQRAQRPRPWTEWCRRLFRLVDPADEELQAVLDDVDLSEKIVSPKNESEDESEEEEIDEIEESEPDEEDDDI